MEEQKIIISQLVDRLVELHARRAEIDAEIEEIIFRLKCIIAESEDKISK